MPAAAQTLSHPAFWKTTFDQHSGPVLAFLISRIGRRDDAEDLLQETFIRAIKAGALRDGGKVRSYLLSIAHRLVIDRARRRRPLLFSEIDDQAQPAKFSDDTVTLPDESAESAWARERLAVAVAGLSEPLRVAFTGAVLEQRPYAELAADNGWTAGQVRVNVHRARKQVITAMRGLLQLDAGENP